MVATVLMFATSLLCVCIVNARLNILQERVHELDGRGGINVKPKGL